MRPYHAKLKAKKKKHHGLVLDVQPVVLYGWDVPQIATYLKNYLITTQRLVLGA